MPRLPRKPLSNLAARLTGPRADAAAGAAGAVLPFAFAPLGWFALAVLAPAALFALWLKATPARAAWRGFLFGLGMFGLGVSWVYRSMHDYGNMPASLAALATALFVAGLALFPALLGYLQARFFDRARLRHAVVVLPALWVLFEWWRGWFLTGFPWLNLGYSQSDSWLSGYASWLGVYGVSFATALSAGLIVAAVRTPVRPRLVCIAAVAALWVAGFAAGKISWAQPDGAALRVALVQGDVPILAKWNPLERGAILDRYRRLSLEAPAADLTVWPESAIPTYLHRVDPAYLEGLRRIARERHTDFLIGVIERDAVDQHKYYNSAIVLGAAEGAYRKRHLVPFGEYVPLKPVFTWLMGSLEIPMSDLSPWPGEQPPLAAAGRRLGVSICYEDAFGEEALRTLPDASILVNLSEDAWFGDSIAAHQRLQMARLRALETARPMLRAANTGPSAIIDHHGAVTARSPQFQTLVLAGEVQPMQGATPYVRLGNTPAVLAALAGVLCGFWRRRV